MKKKILGNFGCLLVVVMFALPMVTYAIKPIPLTANRQFIKGTQQNVDGQMAGNSDNRFTYLEGNYEWTGDIEGIGFSACTRFYASWVEGVPPPQQESTIRVRAFETIDPVVVWLEGEDYEGSLTLRLEYYEDLDDNYKGKWVITSGTGELTNLHGQGEFLPDGSINGIVHFDP